METGAIQNTIWSDSVQLHPITAPHQDMINKDRKSFTLDKHISSCCSFAIFNLQVLVGALVLARLVDCCIKDPQSCAEESRPAAVTNGEAGAGRRGRPTQVLPTAAKQRLLEGTYQHTEQTRTAQNTEPTCTLAPGCRICSSCGRHGRSVSADQVWSEVQ